MSETLVPPTATADAAIEGTATDEAERAHATVAERTHS